jgi:hypothetical protein
MIIIRFQFCKSLVGSEFWRVCLVIYRVHATLGVSVDSAYNTNDVLVLLIMTWHLHLLLTTDHSAKQGVLTVITGLVLWFSGCDQA